MHVGVVRREEISFLIFPKSSNPIILGLPWLKKHLPYLDWNFVQVLSWGTQCHQTCLPKVLPPLSVSVAKVTTSPMLPQHYQTFPDVFCKKAAPLTTPTAGPLPVLSTSSFLPSLLPKPPVPLLTVQLKASTLSPFR